MAEYIGVGGIDESFQTTGGVKNSGWNFKIDWSGTTGGTVKRQLKRGEGEAYATGRVGSPHPNASWLICEKVAVTCDGPLDIVTETYKGIPPNVDTVRYSASVSLSQEPIDTHPDFEDFAGVPSDMVDGVVPATGAIFDDPRDDVGVFEKFAAEIEDPDADGSEANGKYGVSKYLVPSITWSEEKVLGSVAFYDSNDPDIVAVGDVGTRTEDVPRKVFNLAGGAGNFTMLDDLADGNRDWLLVSATWSKVGNGAKLTRKWRLSGRNGWNQDIYEREEVPT